MIQQRRHLNVFFVSTWLVLLTTQITATENVRENPNKSFGFTTIASNTSVNLHGTTGFKNSSNGIIGNKPELEENQQVAVGEEITYNKKISTDTIMGSIQLGIAHAVGSLASLPERDLLIPDFMIVEVTNFPSKGSNYTPAHRFPEFEFKDYAPMAFRHFRALFGIQQDDFLVSMGTAPLREMSNPGASGSIFYTSEDDKFIIKTVQYAEGEFLLTLLPGYYINLSQNSRTLLPKFLGLYHYRKNIQLVVMNNLLPSTIQLHQKYDLKGSTYKRKASEKEKSKKSPTYKDLDFMEHHPEGIFLEANIYNDLIKTIQRDCRVLESFDIMDYSLLVGIHNIDQAAREKSHPQLSRTLDGNLSNVGKKLTSSNSNSPSGIPAKNARGERLLLFVGIIDILQSYGLKKKFEHAWKSLIHDGDTVSVHNPKFYANRFQNFMANTVFKKIQPH